MTLDEQILLWSNQLVSNLHEKANFPRLSLQTPPHSGTQRNLGVLCVHGQHAQGAQGSGHIALDEGDVAVLALGHCPLPERLLQDVAREPLRVLQHQGARGAPLLRLLRQQRRLLPSAPRAASPDLLILDSTGTLEGSLGFDASHGTLENAAAKFSSAACFGNLEAVPLFDAESLRLAGGSGYFQRTEHLLLCFFWRNQNTSASNRLSPRPQESTDSFTSGTRQSPCWERLPAPPGPRRSHR